MPMKAVEDQRDVIVEFGKQPRYKGRTEREDIGENDFEIPNHYEEGYGKKGNDAIRSVATEKRTTRIFYVFRGLQDTLGESRDRNTCVCRPAFRA